MCSFSKMSALLLSDRSIPISSGLVLRAQLPTVFDATLEIFSGKIANSGPSISSSGFWRKSSPLLCSAHTSRMTPFTHILSQIHLFWNHCCLCSLLTIIWMHSIFNHDVVAPSIPPYHIKIFWFCTSHPLIGVGRPGRVTFKVPELRPPLFPRRCLQPIPHLFWPLVL